MPNRRRPAPGVFTLRGRATIVFLTVCTLHRARWLADRKVERDLIASWEAATTWLVGRYILMPDHLHLICSPVEEEVEIERWVTFWKRQFRRVHGDPARRFQSSAFHHRLRKQESYDQRWDYIRANPVRAGLVARMEDWPFTGELNELRW